MTAAPAGPASTRCGLIALGIDDMATFLFNFKKQFSPRVESGEKRQTIRHRRKDGRRPVPGDTAKLYTGLRSRGVKLLRTETVTECQHVRMDAVASVIVIDGRRLPWSEVSVFAQKDGFMSAEEMFRWFREQYGTAFEGFCAKW